MNFFYENEISGFQPPCPPESYKTITLPCCRWVFDTMHHPDNFKAQADKRPRVLNDKSDAEKCAYFALSFHIDAQHSRDHFNFLVNNFCGRDKELAYTRFGRNIAVGTLSETDGVAGDADAYGHFNFHHVKDNNFISKFEISEAL